METGKDGRWMKLVQDRVKGRGSVLGLLTSSGPKGSLELISQHAQCGRCPILFMFPWIMTGQAINFGFPKTCDYSFPVSDFHDSFKHSL
jgi:hypothetical protein